MASDEVSRNQETVRQHIEKLNGREFENAADDWTFPAQDNGRTVSRQDALTELEKIYNEFPDMTVRIVGMVAEKDVVALRVMVTGTHKSEYRPPIKGAKQGKGTAKAVGSGFHLNWYWLKNGKIIEHFVIPDFPNPILQLFLGKESEPFAERFVSRFGPSEAWRLVEMLKRESKRQAKENAGDEEIRRNQEVVREHIEKLNRGDWLGAASDWRFPARVFGEDVGREWLFWRWERIYGRFPDWTMKIVKMVSQASVVAVRVQVYGKDRPIHRLPRKGEKKIAKPTRRNLVGTHLHWYGLHMERIIDFFEMPDDRSFSAIRKQRESTA